MGVRKPGRSKLGQTPERGLGLSGFGVLFFIIRGRRFGKKKGSVDEVVRGGREGIGGVVFRLTTKGDFLIE